MKKLLTFLSTITFAAALHASPIHKMVFFGDSLTDDGNIYKLTFSKIPKSPPYFNGRFSNGVTWAENVSKYYKDKSGTEYHNYALGGATAVFHAPSTKYVAFATLSMEVDKYLLDTLFKDRNDTLFVIWMGDNDYMYYQDAEPDSATTSVVGGVTGAMGTLMNHGAKHFLIMNLTDTSRTPLARANGSVEKLHNLVVLHNQKLNEAIEKIKSEHPDVNVAFFNAYNFLNDMMDNPEKYNRKYNVNLTDTSAACWTGGYTKMLSNPAMLKDENSYSLNQFITSPELAYSYALSVSGTEPCANADEHVFWDDQHPSRIVHEVLGQEVIGTLGQLG